MHVEWNHTYYFYITSTESVALTGKVNKGEGVGVKENLHKKILPIYWNRRFVFSNKNLEALRFASS